MIALSYELDQSRISVYQSQSQTQKHIVEMIATFKSNIIMLRSLYTLYHKSTQLGIRRPYSNL